MADTIIIKGGRVEYTNRPANIIEEVKQNIAFIINTAKYSVPLYRQFGLENTFLDAPQPVAQQRLIAEIYEAIEEFEPRARVKSVTFEGSASGQLIPFVEVEIIDNTQ